MTQRITLNGGWAGFQGIGADDGAANRATTDLINILDTVEVPIVVMRRDFTIAGFNKTATDGLDLTPSDIGRASRDISVLAGVPRLEHQCSQVITSGVESQADFRDGDRWFVVRISPYTTGDRQIAGAVLTFTNVTAFRASIDQAIYERECTKAIVNTVADPLIVLSADQRIQSGNRAFYTMFGVSRDNTQGVSLYELGNGAFELDSLREQLREMLAAGHVFEPVEVDHVFTAQGQRTLILDAHPLFFPGHSERRVLVTFQDITARKQAQAAKDLRSEEELRRSETFLAQGQRLSLTGSFSWKVATDEITWSEQLYRIYELEIGVPVTLELIRTRVHPEDVSLIEKMKMVDQAPDGGNDFEWRYRLMMPDHSIKYLHAVARATRDQYRQLEYIAAVQDVTQQHHARAALQKAFDEIKNSEAKLRQVIDTIPSVIHVLRPDGSVLYVNQAVLDYTDLTVEDTQKEDYRSRVFHPEDVERLREERRQALTHPVPFENEQRALGKDGNYRWFLVRYHPLLDDQGRIVRWYAAGTDITERKEAEEAIRASERKLRQVIDTIPALAWCNLPEGPNEFLNKGWHEYTGLTPEQSVGWGWQAAFHPEDLPPLMEKWQRMLVSGVPDEVEARLRRHDGVYRWFLIRAEPFRDKDGKIVRWYGTSTDIDDRKRAEEKLRRSEAFLAEGQHLARIGNFSWRVATDEITWSEQLYRIFQFDRATRVTLELIGSRVHPEDIAMLNDMIERARGGVSNFEYEHRLLMPDASVKYLHLIAHGIRDNEGRLEYIGAVQDVTQRRSSEEALAKARSELAQVARVTSLGILTASIAHEVNQPLSGIVTNASTCLRMLSSDPPNIEGARETARRTIRDGNRASDVITRLRALFSQKSAINEAIDLNDAAQEVIALLLSDLQRNRVILCPEFAANLPHITGDRVQLQQVILNLLRNASEAMNTVNDRPRKLVIKTERDEDNQVRLSVKDVGVGFDLQAIDRLFDAFYTTKNDGMGIGLSVSRSIVQNHHGRLWASLNGGPGATFSFSIPCRSEGLAVPDSNVPTPSTTDAA